MPTRRVELRAPPTGALAEDFARIRAEFGVEPRFPDDVAAAAHAAARRPVTLDGRSDLRRHELFTVDPPGSLDLDQAMALERLRDGYRVTYAIADVGHFVDRGGVIEAEAWRRGETVYCPDVRAPLYPLELSEGAASLLPGVDRPAVVFTIELDGDGRERSVRVERALVRSRRKLDYATLAGAGGGLLEEIGGLRERIELERGAVRLPEPKQAVVPDPSDPSGYRLEYEHRLPIEDANAQISLLTGMAAAAMMLAAGVGLLRTMEGIDEYRLGALRRAAATLGVAWPADEPYAAFVRRLDPGEPHQAVLIEEAHGVMGPASYTAFSGTPPAQRFHGALAAPYAHATAPLRRLADRYVLDLLCELAADRLPADAERDTLGRLPAVMAAADARSGEVERAIVDDVEARLLEHRLGEHFTAVVVDVDARGARIQIADPPIRARLHTTPAPGPGTTVQVQLVRADPAGRSVQFAAVS